VRTVVTAAVDELMPAARRGWTLRGPAAAVAGGIVGGAVAGGAARLVMFTIRLANPSFNGGITHAGSINGRWTLGGTVTLVLTGVVFGFFGGAAYLALRPFLPGPSAVRGLLFGVLVLEAFGTVVLDGGYEYTRFISKWVAVSAFAGVYVVYGLVVALVVDLVALPRPGVSRRLLLVSRLVVGATAIAGGWSLTRAISVRYLP
jgi:hypothetical protein